jgi:hypothetical protein
VPRACCCRRRRGDHKHAHALGSALTAAEFRVRRKKKERRGKQKRPRTGMYTAAQWKRTRKISKIARATRSGNRLHERSSGQDPGSLNQVKRAWCRHAARARCGGRVGTRDRRAADHSRSAARRRWRCCQRRANRAGSRRQASVVAACRRRAAPQRTPRRCGREHFACARRRWTAPSPSPHSRDCRRVMRGKEPLHLRHEHRVRCSELRLKRRSEKRARSSEKRSKISSALRVRSRELGLKGGRELRL